MKLLVALLLAKATCCFGMSHAPVSQLASYMSTEKYVAEQILSRDFNKNIRPPGSPNPDDPLAITTSMYIFDLGLCPDRQQIYVGGYFRQSWNDPRLAYDFGEEEDMSQGGRTTLFFRDMFADRKIWIPDTFVPGDRDGWISNTPAETGGRSFARVKCCGGVLASTKFRTKSICPVAPNATEVECSLAFESYFHTAEQLTYAFKEKGLMVSDEAKQLLANQGWELVDASPVDTNVAIEDRKYSGVKVVFKMKKIEV